LGWLVLGGLGMLMVVLMSNAQHHAMSITWKEFLNYARQGAFKEGVVVEDDRIVGVLKDARGLPANTKPPYRVSCVISLQTKPYYVEQLNQLGVDYSEKAGGSLLIPLLVSWGPVILIGLLIYFFVFRSIRNAGGPGAMLGNFGRSRHRVTGKEHSNITLADVAGIDEAKEEVGEIIEFLKNPKKFQRLGGRVPRGVLLIGSPGCGKTLLAKAVAGEADVPFFSISGSDFVEMFVGVGASRVRDLFKQAKESSPCIIFLDEIDAVGRRRGNGFSSGGHDEREQTLNAILVEMDGFDTNDQVIVMAATNRADVLDPALTRPGRFDRQIHVPLPDIKGRIEILKVHSRRVKMAQNVDLERLARGTPMFSGADLAAIINEAAIAATLQGKDWVEQDDLEEARDKVKWGRARKSHQIDEQEKRTIAYHEAGHATVMYFDPHAEPLHKVTIIPRGQALGVTFMLPEKDRHIYTRNQLLSQLRVTFGGRIAEEMFCNDISSGAAQDIRQASAIARAMITEYGMSEKLGFLLYAQDESRNPWEQPERLYSEQTARLIDEEVRALIDTTYNQTHQLLEQHRAQVQRLAEELLRYETLTRDEVDKLMRGERLARQTVGDVIKTERGKIAAPSKPTASAVEPLLGNGPAGPLPSPA
jgi:cell division protease FtsH